MFSSDATAHPCRDIVNDVVCGSHSLVEHWRRHLGRKEYHNMDVAVADMADMSGISAYGTELRV